MHRILCTVVVPILLSLAGPAAGEDYPAKPVRIIVPFAAGGGADLLARIVGQHLGRRLGQTVIVENVGGGANTLGMREVASSRRDGHTLGLATPIFVMSPSDSYDAAKDFTPVAMIGFAPMVLVVNPTVPATNVKELIALARARPGTLNYASLGTTSTQGLCALMLNQIAGIDTVEVPYRGSAPGVMDLLAGNVQFMFNGLPSMVPYIESGRLRALGVSSAGRSAQLPAAPAIGETLAGYEVTTWYALVAPAGTPAAVIDRLNREVAEIVEEPDVRRMLRDQGVEARAMAPAELTALFASETAKWMKVVHETRATRR